jgi:2-polyprenyl-3-methyl-5-hydroxy-6-metoxy-1,4-benzoquinol methylase
VQFLDSGVVRAPDDHMNDLTRIYAEKPTTYFGGARDDIVGALETDRASSILELGCGNGATGLAAMAAGKAGRYIGIEIDPSAAKIAAASLSRVIVGDVCQMDLGELEGSFDVVIASEVLEHLTDPWSTVTALAKCLKPGGLIYASSPNIAHWRVIAALFLGRFEYAPDGVMDSTHLRWFTPQSFRGMFVAAGFEVVSIGAHAAPGSRAQFLRWLAGDRIAHLLAVQIMLTGRLA